MNFGSTFFSRLEAIQSSTLSRPKEPDSRKLSWTCGLAVMFNRFTTSRATRSLVTSEIMLPCISMIEPMPVVVSETGSTLPGSMLAVATAS